MSKKSGAVDFVVRLRQGPASPKRNHGQVAEWLMAADCKSARESVRWFESSPVHHPVVRGRSLKSLEMR